MIPDELLDVYLVLARIPARQWAAQGRIRTGCVRQGTAYCSGKSFVLWFETDEAGMHDLRAGRIPAVVKGGPIFYGWAMLSDGSDRMLYRRLAKASGCTSVVFERWQKGFAGTAALRLVLLEGEHHR